MMCGMDEMSGLLFSYVDLEVCIFVKYLLCKIWQVVNEVLVSFDIEFEVFYMDFGCFLILLEWLIWVSLIQILFLVCFECQFMEQMQYNLLFCWFVGFGIDDVIWVLIVFIKNCDWLFMIEMLCKVMVVILVYCEVVLFLLDDYFLVDGMLVKAWVFMKSFQLKGGDMLFDDDFGSLLCFEVVVEDLFELIEIEIVLMFCFICQNCNVEVDFWGEKWFNVIYVLIIDLDVWFYKKFFGIGVMFCFMGYVLMKNCFGLIVQGDLMQVDGYVEWCVVFDMIYCYFLGLI